VAQALDTFDLSRWHIAEIIDFTLAARAITTKFDRKFFANIGHLRPEVCITAVTANVVAQFTWTVSDLKSSADTVPGYPVAGQLWEATATVKSARGPVTPAISQFNARTTSGVHYRLLWQVSGPNTISGATVPQGAHATGKIYFDVTGPSPTIVAMNNGMEDLLVWGS
jgi:hypothetical protein